MNLIEQQEKAWRLAPDDAKWIAQDGDGRFWWYDYKPSSDSDRWLISIRLESDEGYLFDGKINGWDWRDILQSREEWEAMRKEFKRASVEEFEAMNKQDEKWVPEVGQECEYTCGVNWYKCEFVGNRSNGSIVIVNQHGDYKEYHDYQIKFHPIQAPSDKNREERIESMRRVIFRGNGFALHSQKERRIAEEAYDKGVRVLAPDEFVARRLTERARDAIQGKFPNASLNFVDEIIDAVQNAMLGEGND